MSIKHVLFVVLKPQEVDFKALDGRILAIIPNYFEVHENKPTPTDGISQVFSIEVDDSELAQIQEGPIKKLLLWKGDVNSRARPQDKHQLPIASLVPLVSTTTDKTLKARG